MWANLWTHLLTLVLIYNILRTNQGNLSWQTPAKKMEWVWPSSSISRLRLTMAASPHFEASRHDALDLVFTKKLFSALHRPSRKNPKCKLNEQMCPQISPQGER
jgi:hypothetical protein